MHIGEGRYYDGKTLPGFGITYAANLDYYIGRRDLRQCADAAIFMRTAYLVKTRDPKIFSGITLMDHINLWKLLINAQSKTR